MNRENHPESRSGIKGFTCCGGPNGSDLNHGRGTGFQLPTTLSEYSLTFWCILPHQFGMWHRRIKMARGTRWPFIIRTSMGNKNINAVRSRHSILWPHRILLLYLERVCTIFWLSYRNMNQLGKFSVYVLCLGKKQEEVNSCSFSWHFLTLWRDGQFTM